MERVRLVVARGVEGVVVVEGVEVVEAEVEVGDRVRERRQRRGCTRLRKGCGGMGCMRI